MKRFLLIVLIALLGLISIPSQAQTATPTPSLWCIVWDFTQSQEGNSTYPFTSIITGSWSLGVGYSYGSRLAGGVTSYETIINSQTNLPLINFDRVQIFGAFEQGTFDAGGPNIIMYMNGNSTDYLDGPYYTNVNGEFVVDRNGSFVNVASYGFELQNAVITNGEQGSQGNSSVYGFIVYGSSVSVPDGTSQSCTLQSPDGEYAKPLSEIDRLAFGRNDVTDTTTAQQSMIALSRVGISANVHATANGIVTDVRQATESDCETYLGSNAYAVPGQPCRAILEPDLTGDYQYRFFLDGQLDPEAAFFFGDDPLNFYVVEIDIEDDDLNAIYFVADAPEYVTIGTIVGQGCIIGKTIEHDGVITVWEDGDKIGELDGETVQFVLFALEDSVSFVIEDKFDEVDVNPPDLGPCNQDSAFSGCFGDAQLQDPDSWQSSGASWGTNLTLSPGGYIETTMNLDSDLEPEMIVYARSSYVLFEATLGQTVQEFRDSITGSDFKDYTIAGSTHLPDSGELYTIRVENTGTFPLEIAYVCVRHTEGSPQPPPSGDVAKCSFTNYDFRDELDGWSTTGSVGMLPYGGVGMQSSSTLAQAVAVDPGDYYLSVTFSMWGDYPPSSDTTSTLTLEYEYPASNGFVSIGSWTSQDLAIAKNTITTETAITISSSSTITISPNLTASPWGSSSVMYGINVKSICLYPTTDEGPFIEQCKSIAAPTNENLSDWTIWHWQNLDQFFQCDLMVLLNKMYDTMLDQYRLTGWIQRYWIAYSFEGLEWTENRLFPWIAGYLSNIAPSNVTVVSSPTCDNIWCVFVSLFDTINNSITGLFETLNNIIFLVVQPVLDFVITWLNVGFNLLLAIILAVIDLFFIVLEQVLGFFIASRDWLFAVLFAWNEADPIALPGMWDCISAPEEAAICWVLWAAENTIFQGTYGQLIIPLIVSLAYILTFIGWSHKFKRVIRQIGEAL